MQDMGLTDCFSSINRCPVIQEPKHLIKALQLLDSFDQKSLSYIIQEIGKKSSCFVPIKKLIHVVGAIEQMEEGERAASFLTKMEENFSLK